MWHTGLWTSVMYSVPGRPRWLPDEVLPRVRRSGRRPTATDAGSALGAYGMGGWCSLSVLTHEWIILWESVTGSIALG